jgi:hypothetical protein
MLLHEFFDAFWPNVAATFIGIIAGVPIALWLNKSAQRNANNTIREQQKTRVNNALAVLVAAMDANTRKISEYKQREIVSPGRRWIFDIDTSAWDAVKTDFLAEFVDSQHRRDLAFHFLQLSRLWHLNDHLMSYSHGINAEVSGAEVTGRWLREEIDKMCCQLEEDAHRLIKKSRQTQGDLAHGLLE